jgi:uncharacterized protein (DUF58 family)
MNKTFVLDPARMAALHAAARNVAEHARLPFHRRAWRGTGGNWMGTGVGSSIDFQDHRPYLPGDDPRYINWQAYARSGNYSMKLYRQEVSPQVDLVLDVSASMFLEPAKMERGLELFYFCLESAWRTAAPVRVWLWNRGQPHLIDVAELRGYRWTEKIAGQASPERADLSRLPWRSGSLKILISDLLFPGNAEALLKPLAAGRGFAVILAPFAREEAEPDWSGNLELVDCESDSSRLQRVDADTLADYRLSYQRHFELWRLAARKQEALLARVPSGVSLEKAFRFEAFSSGAVEVIA